MAGMSNGLSHVGRVAHLRGPSLLMRARARQLFGYGRDAWSTKLIRGLTTKAPPGFQPRRGPVYDPALSPLTLLLSWTAFWDVSPGNQSSIARVAAGQ